MEAIVTYSRKIEFVNKVICNHDIPKWSVLLCVITFEPIKIQTCLAPQNDGLNPSTGRDTYVQKYSRLRCLLRVKGLVIGFYLGWSGHTLLIRKV